MSNTPTTPAPQSGGNSNYVDIDNLIGQWRVALTNAADTDIAPELNKRGYTAAIIAAKTTELDNIVTLVNNQKKEYGDQYQATENYNQAEATIHEDYIDHLTLARVAFKKDVAAKTALGLRGDRNQSETGYCSQAVQMYKGVLDNATYVAAMNAKGVTTAELQAQKAAFENLYSLSSKKYKETGEAQAATKARDKAIDDFSEWFADFREVAKVALRKFPQLREKMGWKEE